MTARLSAAESFLTELDALAAAKRPGEVRMIYVLAAETIRGLLDEIQVLHSAGEVADDELDELLRRAAEHANRKCPEHGLMCKGADCCCAGKHPQDVPRPGRSDMLADSEESASPGPGALDLPARPRYMHPAPGGSRMCPGGDDCLDPDAHALAAAKAAGPDLSHLPPMAADGQDRCGAESPENPLSALGWICTARTGHPGRWHAMHTEAGTPYAEAHPGSAWPVTEARRGWPSVLLDSPGPFVCGNCGSYRWSSTDGLTCQCGDCGQSGPLVEHGAKLARWASVLPGAVGTTEPDGFIEVANNPAEITEAEHAEAVAYLKAKYGSIPPPIQYVIEEGGRIKRRPIDLRSNGHALRPPEWVCSGCSNRFAGRKPEDGRCNVCAPDGEEPHGTFVVDVGTASDPFHPDCLAEPQ